MVFNAMIDKRPAVIAQCTSPADVIDALALAGREGYEVAVRAGGHSVAGMSVNDGGIVVDVRSMNTTEVDPDARQIRVGAGATWGEFDRATQQHGLATTGGRVSTTGVAGLTLGGGSGWLERRFGLSCDSLIAVDLVTADGRQVTASADETPTCSGPCMEAAATSVWRRRACSGFTQWPARHRRVDDWPGDASTDVARACTETRVRRAGRVRVRLGVPYRPTRVNSSRSICKARPSLPSAALWSGDIDEGDRGCSGRFASCPRGRPCRFRFRTRISNA